MISSKEVIKIWDNVPDDYEGPLYYRVLGNNYYADRNPIGSPIMFEDKKKIDELLDLEISVPNLEPYIREALYDADGNLLPKWQNLRAKKKKTAHKTDFDREVFGCELGIVTSEIAKIYDEAEPGVYHFIPIDIEYPDGLIKPYRIMKGARHMPDEAVAVEKGGFIRKTRDDGLVYWLASADFNIGAFIYLNSEYVKNINCGSSRYLGLYSAELMEKLKDDMPDRYIFVPMGVV